MDTSSGAPRPGDEPSPELEAEEAYRYRRGAALLVYLAQDRPDLCHVTVVLGRAMAKPTAADGVRLKHAIRYLAGAPSLQLVFACQDDNDELYVTTDSDWGTDPATRKSVSGGVVQRGARVTRLRSGRVLSRK